MTLSGVVLFTIIVAIAFDVINGFHDAANSIATIVSTRLLSPRKAVIWAATFNFVALFVFHQGVAKTVSSLVHVNAADPAFVWVVLAGLIGAIIWNLLTWWLALPSSSSHAIMGGFSGAGFAYGGLKVLEFAQAGAVSGVHRGVARARVLARQHSVGRRVVAAQRLAPDQGRARVPLLPLGVGRGLLDWPRR
ncbi:MAG: inorganic phosphate transporter [Polyangiaceae bacterium]